MGPTWMVLGWSRLCSLRFLFRFWLPEPLVLELLIFAPSIESRELLMWVSGCPFNALYWDFIARNEDTLRGNPRMGLVYKNLDKKPDDEINALRERADHLLKEFGAL